LKIANPFVCRDGFIFSSRLFWGQDKLPWLLRGLPFIKLFIHVHSISSLLLWKLLTKFSGILNFVGNAWSELPSEAILSDWMSGLGRFWRSQRFFFFQHLICFCGFGDVCDTAIPMTETKSKPVMKHNSAPVWMIFCRQFFSLFRSVFFQYSNCWICNIFLTPALWIPVSYIVCPDLRIQSAFQKSLCSVQKKTDKLASENLLCIPFFLCPLQLSLLVHGGSVISLFEHVILTQWVNWLN